MNLVGSFGLPLPPSSILKGIESDFKPLGVAVVHLEVAS